jgi:hypothetical protein
VGIGSSWWESGGQTAIRNKPAQEPIFWAESYNSPPTPSQLRAIIFSAKLLRWVSRLSLEVRAEGRPKRAHPGKHGRRSTQCPAMNFCCKRSGQAESRPQRNVIGRASWNCAWGSERDSWRASGIEPGRSVSLGEIPNSGTDVRVTGFRPGTSGESTLSRAAGVPGSGWW